MLPPDFNKRVIQHRLSPSELLLTFQSEEDKKTFMRWMDDDSTQDHWGWFNFNKWNERKMSKKKPQDRQEI